MNKVKKERVLRVLGIHREITFKELVSRSKVTKSYVSKILKELRERGLIIIDGNRIKVIDLEEFIRYWGLVKRTILTRVNSFLTDTLFIERLISSITSDYVLSGQYVENLITNQSPGHSLWVYIFNENEYIRLYKQYGKRRVGRIRVILYDDHIKYGSTIFHGYKIVALEQLAADLVTEGIFTDIKQLVA